MDIHSLPEVPVLLLLLLKKKKISQVILRPLTDLLFYYLNLSVKCIY